MNCIATSLSYTDEPSYTLAPSLLSQIEMLTRDPNFRANNTADIVTEIT